MSSRVKRILLLNYEFPPLGGGAAAASFEIARRLASRGVVVDVVTSRFGPQRAFEEIGGLRIHRVWCTGRELQDCGLIGAATYLASAVPVCRRLLRENVYDVVHYFFGLPTAALIHLVPGISRLPSVISLRGSDVPGYDDTDRTLPSIHFLLHPFTRSIWRRGSRIVANSRGLCELASDFMPQLDIGVIANAAPSPRPDVFRRQARDEGRVRLLCVARLAARKGIPDLLRAVAMLSDVDIELTLQGSGADRRSLERLARKLGITDRVDFAGFTAREALSAVYAAADIFVLPSHSESCSMALLEAMSMGLPVVATRVGGNSELIEDGVGGRLVETRSPRILADALRKLVADPALRERMGAHNAEAVRNRFSWERVAEAYLEEYERAIESFARAAS